MIILLKKLRQSYGDLKLQTKITIVLMIAVTVPALMIAILFYGRFYNMVISDTIGTGCFCTDCSFDRK